MKKSTLLSLLTAGAVIATSAGTFAAQDQTEVTQENAAVVTIDNKVTMSINDMTFTTPEERSALVTGDNFEALAQTSSITVNVNNLPNGAKSQYKLTYSAEVKDSTNADASGLVNVEINDTKADILAGGATDPHTATVTVTPKSADAAGETYNVKVTAKLEPKSVS